MSSESKETTLEPRAWAAMVMATSSAGPSAVVDPSSSENSFLESAYESGLVRVGG